MRNIIFIILLELISHVVIAQENEIAIVPQDVLRDAVHEMIATAKHEILLAHFILLKDKSGLEVINHLIFKAKEGVKVKLLIDGMGAYSDESLSKKHLQEIVQSGIEVKVYHPKWRNFHKIKNRMHDKILIVDGKGLVGSSSFWDVSFDRWQVETDVLLRGNIVNQIIDHFNTLWHSNEVKIIKKKNRKLVNFWDDQLVLQNVISDLNFIKVSSLEYWNDGNKKISGRGSYQKTLDLIRQAKKKIIIVNPYFLPEKSLNNALRVAAKNGVAIEIYTNSSEVLALEYKMLGVSYSQIEKKFKNWNVTVYEAPENFGMVHSKILFIDDKKIYIGGQNLDPLGANHNTENGICFESEEIKSWLLKELMFFKNNFVLAAQNGVIKRKPYCIKNKFKWYWRKFLANSLRNVL